MRRSLAELMAEAGLMQDGYEFPPRRPRLGVRDPFGEYGLTSPTALPIELTDTEFTPIERLLLAALPTDEGLDLGPARFAGGSSLAKPAIGLPASAPPTAEGPKTIVPPPIEPTKAPLPGGVHEGGEEELAEVDRILRSLGLKLTPEQLREKALQFVGPAPPPYQPKELSPWVYLAALLPALGGAIMGRPEAAAPITQTLMALAERRQGEVERAEAKREKYESGLARAMEFLLGKSQAEASAALPILTAKMGERVAARDRALDREVRERLGTAARLSREKIAGDQLVLGYLRETNEKAYRDVMLEIRRRDQEIEEAESLAAQATREGNLTVAQRHAKVAEDLATGRLQYLKDTVDVQRKRLAIDATRAAQAPKSDLRGASLIMTHYRALEAELEDIQGRAAYGTVAREQQVADARAKKAEIEALRPAAERALAMIEGTVTAPPAKEPVPKGGVVPPKSEEGAWARETFAAMQAAGAKTNADFQNLLAKMLRSPDAARLTPGAIAALKALFPRK